MRGWWGMHCWNGLSEDQQARLVLWGNLPMGYVAEGECERPAAVGIETEDDLAPGPRFYCRECAIEFLQQGAAVKKRRARGRR